MRCEEIREKLLEAARGREVPPEIKLHLQKCEACSGFLEEHKALFRLLEAEEGPSLKEVRDPQYLVSLRQRIDRSDRAWLLGLPRPALGLTLASVAAVLLLIFGIWNFSNRYPHVASYSPSTTLQYVEESVSTYLGAEEELAYLLSHAEVQEDEYFGEFFTSGESNNLLQAEELLYPEESLENLLRELSEEELQILSHSIQNLISALPLRTEGVKRC
jgi:hypothetical protein